MGRWGEEGKGRGSSTGPLGKKKRKTAGGGLGGKGSWTQKGTRRNQSDTCRGIDVKRLEEAGTKVSWVREKKKVEMAESIRHDKGKTTEKPHEGEIGAWRDILPAEPTART